LCWRLARAKGRTKNADASQGRSAGGAFVELHGIIGSVGDIELGALGFAPRGAVGAGSTPLATAVDVYLIPRADLLLEEEPFARGGGGEVFKGQYMGNAVAAKKTFSNMSGDDQEDFRREVAMLTKLTHPCILSMYGESVDADGSMLMVMEYCGGGDLDHYYQTPHFNNREYVRVCLGLLSGVAYVHGRKIAQ
jgi:hypothetical protein